MRSSRKSFIAIILLFFIIAVALAVAPIIMQNISFYSLSEPERAFFLAESGVYYYMKHELSISDGDWSNNDTTIVRNFGGGNFTVSVPAGGATTNSVKLRSIGTVTLGATAFRREIEYVVKRVNPFSYLLYGEGDADLDHANNTEIDGDIYIGGEIDIEHAANIEIDGEIDDNQPEADIPEVDWAYWQANADQVITGDYEFDQVSYTGIYYIENGDATLTNNNTTINGTVIVKNGSISVPSPVNNITLTADFGNPTLVAEFDVDLGNANNATVTGAIYAGNNLILDQVNNFTMIGSMIFGGDFCGDHENNADFIFEDRGIGAGFLGGQQEHGLRSFKEITG